MPRFIHVREQASCRLGPVKETAMTRRRFGCLVTAAFAASLLLAGPARADDRTRTFQAPVDRVWTVTRSVLKSLGWDIDKEDRDVGWITTDSRRVEGENYGVYEKALRHRLRIVIKGGGGVTDVTIERRLYKSERQVFVTKEEDVPVTDHDVERKILDEIGRSL
jgi:hypothetical protein